MTGLVRRASHVAERINIPFKAGAFVKYFPWRRELRDLTAAGGLEADDAEIGV